MKKPILLLITIFGIFTNLAAQARLGSTSSAIQTEFSASEYKLESGITDDSVLYIAIEMPRSTVIYYFNKTLICFMTLIFPDDQGALNYYVEQYNKSYVIISAKQWRAYLEEGIADIDLIYAEDGVYYFVWTDHE
jgi:hypothetical protein